jgi:ABC-2 type transport system permease protein
MLSIFSKEIRLFFSSIVGYVVIVLFILVSGMFLWILPDTNMFDYGYASMEKFFSFAPWILIFLIPAICMRTFSDEFKTGTIELLSTKPLKENSIIMGKFWASFALVCICLIPSLLYVVTLYSLAIIENNLDTGGIIGSYIGLLFLISAFTSISLFCSSMTDNQVVAFLIAVFLNFILYQGFEAISGMEALSGGLDYIISQIGLQFHYQSISRGVIDTRDIIYFISITLVFLFATRLFLQKRKWN